LAILTGGTALKKSVNQAVANRLKELALVLKEFAATDRDGRSSQNFDIGFSSCGPSQLGNLALDDSQLCEAYTFYYHRKS
jgi:hypothetical protein